MGNIKIVTFLKTSLFIFLLIFLMQSCIVPVKRDYEGYSRALVFTQNKKWLINDIFTDLNSTQREKLNQKILARFNSWSGGNAYSVNAAKSENLLPSNIPYILTEMQLEDLKENSNFDYLVNIRTVQIRDELGTLELNKPFQYSKNSAFAILEVYDLKTGKKIYYQKAYSEMELDRAKQYPEISADQVYRNDQEKKDKGPFFSYSAAALSIKNLKKILKDIDKNAVR